MNFDRNDFPLLYKRVWRLIKLGNFVALIMLEIYPVLINLPCFCISVKAQIYIFLFSIPLGLHVKRIANKNGC